MTEIIVRGNYSAAEIRKAEMKRAEFKRNPYTSGSAHLDDLITLGKAILLCDQHARKFNARVARYEPHPSPNMRRGIGSCDVCGIPGLGRLYVCGKDAVEHRMNWERFRRAAEYAHLTAK